MSDIDTQQADEHYAWLVTPSPERINAIREQARQNIVGHHTDRGVLLKALEAAEAERDKLSRKLDLAYRVTEEADVEHDAIMRDFGAPGDDTPRDVIMRLRDALLDMGDIHLKSLAALNEKAYECDRAWARVKRLEAWLARIGVIAAGHGGDDE